MLSNVHWRIQTQLLGKGAWNQISDARRICSRTSKISLIRLPASLPPDTTTDFWLLWDNIAIMAELGELCSTRAIDIQQGTLDKYDFLRKVSFEHIQQLNPG